jgi:hypothetical protein
MLAPITRQLGGVGIPRAECLKRLATAVELRCTFLKRHLNLSGPQAETLDSPA